MAAALPEMEELLRMIDAARGRVEVRVIGHVDEGARSQPLIAVCLGSASRDAPGAGFFGGVHGLERVGTQVVLSFLGSLIARLDRDDALVEQLSRVRLVFMPIVNPGGMLRGTRANPRGVDLMRNAPVDSRERVPLLAGGHRISRALPWYRGVAGAPMERESAALCALVRDELIGRPLAIALDCHSGFGLRDRVWFPHAHTRSPFARIAEVHALLAQFDALYPRHAYVFEPQSRQYLTHGDLWDYLCVEAAAADGVFVPLTLEMGSWRWIRKSPRQVLSRLGLFNPLPADRLARVRRNHLLWLGFLVRAAWSYRDWLPSAEARARHHDDALRHWFGRMA